MPASSILLLERDVPSAELIQRSLSAAGSMVTVLGDAAAVIAAAAEHTLVMIDVTDPSTTAADVCRELRSKLELASIPVLCICQTDDVEERIRFLEAGADDVIAKPFDARELEARVEALAVRFNSSRELTPLLATETGQNRARTLVAVYSPKGGAGTTTLATNVATVMAERRPGRVAILDLDLQFGQVATHLNVRPRQTIADLARDDQSRRDIELIRTYAATTSYGLAVFAAPASPELAETVSVAHVEELLSTTCAAYESVVVDAGSYLDERSLSVLERAEGVVIPIYPDIAALKAVHVLIDYLNETGSIVSKTSFILNNLFAREILKLRDVESGLGAKIALDLPYDPFLYQKAVNEGIPLVRGAARTVIAERFAQIASLAFDEQGTPVLVAGPPLIEDRKPGGLFGRRR
ncbi:MAG: AAA family ATPase [Candidatus Limnocylindrales bacterium]